MHLKKNQYEDILQHADTTTETVRSREEKKNVNDEILASQTNLSFLKIKFYLEENDDDQYTVSFFSGKKSIQYMHRVELVHYYIYYTIDEEAN